jgi:hypothetical protein
MNYLQQLAERIRAEVPEDALPPEDTRLLFLMYAVRPCQGNVGNCGGRA